MERSFYIVIKISFYSYFLINTEVYHYKFYVRCIHIYHIFILRTILRSSIRKFSEHLHAVTRMEDTPLYPPIFVPQHP